MRPARDAGFRLAAGRDQSGLVQLAQRILRDPTRHRCPRFAGQRVRSAEIAVELMDGQPIQVVRSSFNILTFKGLLRIPARDFWL